MHGTLVDVEVIKDAVRLARAPSLHNSQPWRFEVDGESCISPVQPSGNGTLGEATRRLTAVGYEMRFH